MADIFGKTIEDYPQYTAVTEQGGDPLAYARQNAERNPLFQNNPGFRREHNFDVREQAVVGAEPFGFITDNLVAFQAQVERVRYEQYRLDQWVPIKTDVDEGATSVGFSVMDFEGSAGWTDDAGTSLQPVKVSQSPITYPVRAGGAVAEYTREQLRNAQFMGLPLTTELIDEATRRCFRFLEMRGLMGETGTNADWAGLINQRTRASASAANPERVIAQNVNKNFLTDPEKEVAEALSNFISNVSIDSNQLIGGVIGGELIIGLPPTRYAAVSTRTVDNQGSDISIMAFVERYNTWLGKQPGNTLRFAEVKELETAHTGNTPRIAAWVNNSQVMEYAMPIAPRVTEDVRREFATNVPLEFKGAPALYVKYSLGMRYGYGV